MPVTTRSSSFPATRSRDRKKLSWATRGVTVVASHKANGSLSGAKKARQAKGGATRVSQAASRASRAQLEATPSSSTTGLERERESRRPETSRASSSLSRRTSARPARSSRKRTADVLEDTITTSPIKRKRTAPAATNDAETRALDERESALSEREDAVRERELALQTREEFEKTVKQLEKKISKLTQKVKNSKAQYKQDKQQWEAQFQQANREWEAKVKTITDERDVLVELCEAEKAASVDGPAVARPPSANLQWLLSHLEEQFQCSLCFEIMASPYSLNNGRCGHAFCAICILKWAFAAVHRGCGYWHDALECPLCRATLPLTSDDTPRNICTFPFVPDRLAEAAIKSHLTVLLDAADSNAKPIACAKGQDGTHWHGVVDEQVIAWGQGMASRTEWEQREKSGKTQMTLLFNNWSQYEAEDFLAMKDGLEAA
ncbi:hypothetical protein L226DRAFT_372864 [Lentinus tigrinus ALCF2SS1-7]|uniref:uncharacterized protein n=1 Tax=Lentinus tigrinus ALCF2SS1-7 TaxID=1328758 RepID=UPI00116638AC|nr:hypothetical protein L226DRAFT_372864 [Lentinus tigrinus ALCF2SS1-7]